VESVRALVASHARLVLKPAPQFSCAPYPRNVPVIDALECDEIVRVSALAMSARDV
jgi:hypothetical protein